MSGIINVQFDNVFSTTATLHGNIRGELQGSRAMMNRARSTMQEHRGMGNDAALEGLVMIEQTADLFASTAEHFLAAIASSARHIQAEEREIANNFNFYSEHESNENQHMR